MTGGAKEPVLVSEQVGVTVGRGCHTGSVCVLLVEATLDNAPLLLLKLLGPTHVTAVAGAASLPGSIHWCLLSSGGGDS